MKILLIIISMFIIPIVMGADYVDYYVTQSSDDANTYDSLDIFTTTAMTITYGKNPTFGICKNYLRFSDILIDSGEVIDSAFLYLNGSFVPTANLSTKLYFEDTDSANTYTGYTDTSRAKIAQSVSWTATTSWLSGSYNQSPDLQVPIQALIDRGGWKNGNAIGIAWLQGIKWTLYLSWKGYDYSSGTYAAYLRIYYNVSTGVKTQRRRRMLAGE